MSDKGKSETLKAWNRQARAVAKSGQCCAINCTAKVAPGVAWCDAHK